MIGLALSMGASSLLLPRHDDGAVAAEPLPTHAASPASTASVIEHLVQEGQTLWQISRHYRVSVDAIARANGIAVDAIIRAGQTIQVPLATRTFVAPETIASENSPTPSGGREVSPSISSSEAVNPLRSVDDAVPQTSDSDLRSARNSSLSRLRHQRDKLRDSLAEFKMEESKADSIADPSRSAFSQSGENSSTLSLATPDADKLSVSEEAGFLLHKVKPGDTLGAIALNYGISQQQIASVNRLADPDQLKINESLLIPKSVPSMSGLASSASAIDASAPSLQAVVTRPGGAAPPSTTLYRVRPGDTIHQIARTYGISRASLLETNQLANPNFILVGQVLRIPASDSNPVGTSPGNTSADVTVNVPVSIASTSPMAGQFTPEATSTTVPSLTQLPTVVTVPMVPPSETVAVPNSLVSPDLSSNSTVFSTGNPPIVESSQTVAASSSVALEMNSGAASSGEATSAAGPGLFVENLMTEILSLRARYEGGVGGTPPVAEQAVMVAAAPTDAAPDAAPALPELADPSRVNPQFSSEQNSEAEVEAESRQPERRPEALQDDSELESSTIESDATPSEFIAAAPIGSEHYRPLLRPLAGQLVSPDLPPLPEANAFLPESSVLFDGYIWPARGTLTSGYGWRWGRMHRGIDVAAPVGTPVHAAADGVVEFAGWNSGGYGNMVEIRHADGSMTRYAHHSRNLVRAGQRVDQGQQIAEIGSTGYSTGPHLHFEVHLPSQGTVNPIAYLPR
jgi:murein DD-endopeptidase MepM/ murein hydrolase activator NlpD